MSLYSAMYAGVSALQSQSSAMAAIGDNIANVSTIGYKNTDVSFSTLVTKQTTSTSYSSGGVIAKSTQNVSTQGSLTATTSSTDIALSGNGFFVVNTSATPSASQGLMCYTRGGSFSVDQNGYLVNDSGYYMMGWPLQKANGTEPSTSQLDVNGDLYARSYAKTDGSTYYVNTNVVDNNELQSLNLYEMGGSAEATLNITLGANLPADNAVGTVVETTASVYDALGITHNIDWAWTKSSANNWDLSMTPASGAATVSALNSEGGVYFASGQLEFTGTWDTAVTIGEINGIQFDVDGNTYTLDNTKTLAQSDPTTAGVIGISDARSWEDVTTAIVLSLNRADVGTTGQFGTGTKPTTYDAVQGRFEDGAGDPSTGGPNGDGTRYSVSADGYSVIFTQSGDGAAVSMGNFVDGTAGADLMTYLVTAGATTATTPTFTIAQLDQANGNYYGADISGDGDMLDAADIPHLSGMVFNGDGSPKTINVTDMEVVWANGANDMTGDAKVSLFFGNPNLTDGITQLSAPYQVNYLTQDGAKFGNFAGVEISADGVVTALYDNGVRTPIFQIPVATFVNPNGMEALTGNAWIQTDTSGSYTLHIAGSAGAGDINAAALESSTVDLSSEFTTMIVTQRAYSAASKVITTANSMMDDLLAIIR